MRAWPYPRVLAHRGAGTLAPENTYAALREGIRRGFHAIEFDIMLARDGVPVVLHDTELGRTVAGHGSVSNYDSAALAQMDAGSWFDPRYADETVPLFDAFVQLCQREQVWMNMEIKPVPGFEAATGKVVAGSAAQLFSAALETGDSAALPLLSSFSEVALAGARLAAPDLPRAWLLSRLPRDWQQRACALDVRALHLDQRHLSQAQAQAVRGAGFGLFCYTVNDPERARRLLSWGVEAFCTDRIDLFSPDFAERTLAQQASQGAKKFSAD